jgi:hypothetical protein
VVAPPFKQWAARTALAVAAFKAAGATDAQVASFGQSYAAQIEALTDAGGAQSPPDPIDAAARAGIDRNRLMTAANTFVQTNGSFEAFAATLGQDVTLTPAAEQKLEQLYPCAADLANFITRRALERGRIVGSPVPVIRARRRGRRGRRAPID